MRAEQKPHLTPTSGGGAGTWPSAESADVPNTASSMGQGHILNPGPSTPNPFQPFFFHFLQGSKGHEVRLKV